MAEEEIVKKEMRKPEPSDHPDRRMNMTIKDPLLRIPRPSTEIKLSKEEGGGKQ